MSRGWGTHASSRLSGWSIFETDGCQLTGDYSSLISLYQVTIVHWYHWISDI